MKMNSSRFVCSTALLAILLLLPTEWSVADAEDANQTIKSFDLRFSSAVFAERGSATATFADLETLLDLRVPPEDQAQFLSSAERLGRLLDSVLVTEALVQRADAAGLLSEPATMAKLYRISTEAARALYLEYFVSQNALEDYESLAREIYLSEPRSFMLPESVDFEHLFIQMPGGLDEVSASQLVLDIQANIDAESSLDTLLNQVIAMTGDEQSSGLFEGVRLDELVEPLVQYFQGAEVGLWSAPIRSGFGWHFVRLLNRQEGSLLPWEEARPSAIVRAEQRHRRQLEERLLREIQSTTIRFEPDAVKRLLDMYGVEGLSGHSALMGGVTVEQ